MKTRSGVAVGSRIAARPAQETVPSASGTPSRSCGVRQSGLGNGPPTSRGSTGTRHQFYRSRAGLQLREQRAHRMQRSEQRHATLVRPDALGDSDTSYGSPVDKARPPGPRGDLDAVPGGEFGVTLPRWVSTVPTEMDSSAAISALVSPVATSRTTSVSRAYSTDCWCSGGSRRRRRAGLGGRTRRLPAPRARPTPTSGRPGCTTPVGAANWMELPPQRGLQDAACPAQLFPVPLAALVPTVDPPH